MRMQIMLTEFQAIRQAKADFANILGISRSSVHVSHDSFYESRNSSTQCCCGETACVYLQMSNAGKRQLERLEKVIHRPGAVLAYGICECCGESF